MAVAILLCGVFSMKKTLQKLSLFFPPPFFLKLYLWHIEGVSWARGQIRAAAASLHQSHSNAGSEAHLQSTPQLTETPDP